MVIRNGTMTIEDFNQNIEGLQPEWAVHEKELLLSLRKDKDKNAFFYFYYPNKENLVVNALLSGLDIRENSVYVNRATFDFIISH